MQLADARKVGLELCKAALGAGDDRSGLDALIRREDIVQLLALARLIHEQAEVLLHRDIEHGREVPRPAHLRDDAAARLLCCFLGDALPALELFLGLIGLCDAALAVKEHDLIRAGFDAFLDDIIGLVALRQAAEHSHLDARLRRAGDDLDDLGLDLLLIGADKAALIVRALPVADYHILARTQAQHAYMLGVPTFHYRHAAQNIGTGHEKSRHFHLSYELNMECSLCRNYRIVLAALQEQAYNRAEKNIWR